MPDHASPKIAIKHSFVLPARLFDSTWMQRQIACDLSTLIYHRPHGTQLALDCREAADADTQVRAPAALEEGEGHGKPIRLLKLRSH